MPDSIVHSRRRVRPEPDAALVAAAKMYGTAAEAGTRRLIQTDAPQAELWSFYKSLGEFGSFVDWLKNAASRVRLGAAEVIPGADEPKMLREGPAAQLIEDFYGGTSGHAQFLQAMVPQLIVPGEGWIVAERFDSSVPLSLAKWSVQSNETIRADANASGGYRVQVDEGQWRSLMPDSLPVRVWMPDPERPWRALSPAMMSLPIMRTIDLVNKRIIAELLSRIVMNGILWIPLEGELPASPAYKDRPDPFFAEFIDIASKNIGTPGSALAAVPMPVKFQGDLIEKIRHMKMADPLDEQLLIERDKELARLAKSLPLSPERQQGMADSNHWSAWVIDDSDIKISIAPLCEIIYQALTIGYLQPMLAVSGQPLVGPDGGRLIVWGDYSELAAPPDKLAGTQAAYDRGEANGSALRREAGLTESDKPTGEEQREMIWLAAARDGSSPSHPIAVTKLTGETPAAPAPVGPESRPSGIDAAPAPAGPPQSSSPTASPEPLSPATVAAMLRPKSPAHVVNGNGRR